MESESAVMRQFASGATRNDDTGKLQWRRHLSMPALRQFIRYMHTHRIQADGKMRDPDNWKKGIPLEAYADSLYRHAQEFALTLELGYDGDDLDEQMDYQMKLSDTLCAIIFNAFGYLHEMLRTPL